MAATGKTPILLYGSTTATNVPSAGNLTNSSGGCEIAINVADKNLFFKDSTNAVNTVPIRQSSASSNGWLSSTDWSTFNGKAPAFTYTTNYIPYGQGTTTPTQSSAFTFNGSTLTVQSAINVNNSNFANITFTGSSANPSGVYTGLDSGGGFALNVRDAGYIDLATNNTNRLRVFSSGGVSIGNTTDPGAANLKVTGFTDSAFFRPTGPTVPTNGMYLPATNTVAFATNSTFAYQISADQRIQIGSSSTLGKLGIYGDAVNFSPSADNATNGIGCCIVGSNVASATSAAAKLYMSGANSAHSGNLALYSGSVVTSSITLTNTAGATKTAIDGNGNATLVGVYSTTVGATNRDLYIDDTGKLGCVSSVRESKTNIADLNDVSWLNQLSPVTFNRKKKENIFSDDEFHVKIGERYIDEHFEELEYGLIAEDVEQINPELCFYDEVDGNKKLAGVHYSKLVVPLLKKIQELENRIKTLEAK